MPPTAPPDDRSDATILVCALLPWAALVTYVWLPRPVRFGVLGTGVLAVGTGILGVDLLRRGRFAELGLGLEGWRGASAGAAVALGLALPPLLWLWAGGGYHRDPDLLVELGTYPLWALVQLVFFLGYVQPRLGDAIGRSGAIAATGLLFGATHLPDPRLAAITLPLGLLFAFTFDRAPCLWPLALAHGILGTGVDALLDWPMSVGADAYIP